MTQSDLPKSHPTISVVIPNWNGSGLLGPCLESVKRALVFAGAPRPWEIVVADDGSTDDSLDLLRASYPEVVVTTGAKRLGFIANANRGVERCTNPYFLLLNNDVTLAEDFFANWSARSDDPELFSVTSRMLRPDRVTFDSGRRVGVWDRGLIRHWVVCREGTSGPTLYGSGGASIYSTDKFRALGGFDTLFRPMYHEDMDVSYRAWKRGWKTIYEPSYLAYHHGSVSSKKAYRARELSGIIAKNHYLFIWKNITDPGLIRQHLVWLPFWLAQGWRTGRRVVTLAMLQALPRLKEAATRRAIERAEQRVSDRWIWDTFRPTAEDLAYSPYQGLAGTA